MTPCRRTRIAHLRDIVTRPEELDDRAGVRLVPLDADMQCPKTAQHQEAVEWAGDGAHGVLQEPQPLGDLVVRGHGDTEHDIGVAGGVLRRGMEDDVRTQRERPLDGG